MQPVLDTTVSEIAITYYSLITPTAIRWKRTEVKNQGHDCLSDNRTDKWDSSLNGYNSDATEKLTGLSAK